MILHRSDEISWKVQKFYGSNDPVTRIAIIFHISAIRSLFVSIVMYVHHSKVAGFGSVE